MSLHTYEDVVARIERIIDVKGTDFVYEIHQDSPIICFYALNGKPDCIVGHLLVELGVPVEVLEYEGTRDLNAWDHDFASDTISNHWAALESQYALAFTDEARTYLRALQSNQDNGRTWGWSNMDAKDMTERLRRARTKADKAF